MRVGVIRNPKSGRGAGERKWPSLEAELRRRLHAEIVVELTTAPGSATRQAQEMARIGFDWVIAVGGDGTVTDVMQGLVGTSSALGILPQGTGNDFARTIGVGPKIDLALRALEQGVRRRIDLAHWHQSERSGYFMNVAGCGFDAAVAERINTGLRYMRGRIAYLAAVLSELARFQPVEMSVQLDDEVLHGSTMLCAIANARSYGGGMLVAPTAKLDDGLLDVVLVDQLSRTEFLRAFPRVFKGSHLSHPKVRHRTTRTLSLSTTREVPFLVDGELLPPGPIQIQVEPLALEVICPPLAEGGF